MNSAYKTKRSNTKTSAFGCPGRFGYDARSFYSSRLYEGLAKEKTDEFVENTLPDECLNQIFCKSSENMEELPENSIHLMVTSPPYNVGKEYDKDLSIKEYRDFLRAVWSETKRVLVNGGRACINIANLGRKPYIPLHAYIIEDMLDLGFLMRGEIIWNKASSGSSFTAWGSWLSAKNPSLRDIHEYILIFSKDNFARFNINNTKESTMTKEEFLEFTKSIWTFPAEQATKIGHPAPFPIELPYRLIQLYTFKGDVILDPFIGSGQTALASIRTQRYYVGYDTSEEYVRLAKKRVSEFQRSISTPQLF